MRVHANTRYAMYLKSLARQKDKLLEALVQVYCDRAVIIVILYKTFVMGAFACGPPELAHKCPVRSPLARDDTH